MQVIHLGIADFSIPVPRTGSIEAHSGYGPVPMVGQEIHEAIQRQRREQFPNYEAERRISQSFERESFRFQVSGRMDGFIPGLTPAIEEIKSTYNIDDLRHALEKNKIHPYSLQLQTYGYFFWLETGVIPDLKLHLVSSRTRSREDFKVDLDIKIYEEWLEKRLDELVSETKMFAKIAKKRQKMSKNLPFPFVQARTGQLELVAKIEEGFGLDKSLFIQAPTGLGKTSGVLYPSLKEALSRGEKVVYVTPKNSQHSVAEQAVESLQNLGVKVLPLTVQAKGKMCFKDEVVCNPTYCEFAKDHYDKIAQNKLVDKLARKKTLTPNVVKKVAREYEVCPFELQLDVISRGDVVICDYNYVFSPRNILGRLTYNGPKKKGAPNLVVDEAHNLPSRAMDYFSPRLSVGDLRASVLREPLEFVSRWQELITRSISLIESFNPLGASEPFQVVLEKDRFAEIDTDFFEFLGAYLKSDVVLRPKDPVLRVCHLWNQFTTSLDLLNEKFFTTYKSTSSGGVLQISCCDASEWLAESYKSFRQVVCFSATLKPFDYYIKLSGFKESTSMAVEFLSPFPEKHRKLLIVPQVSTKFRDRTQNSDKIVSVIERVLRVRPGNYFVFFPSFDFLEKILLRVSLPEFLVLSQKRETTMSEIQNVLAVLRDASKPTVVFAVQGGVFAEGVDYPGEMVIGALVVGPGLPSFDFDRELLRSYYEKAFGNGYDYAYTFPAMAKVVQSAGRVIRSAEDRGLVVLMDGRFLQESFTKAMPSDWTHNSVHSLVSKQIIKDISEFWGDECLL